MPEWISPTVFGLLIAVVGFVGRRLICKLDELDSLMRTELRAMDVRIARIEEHIWPRK